MLAFQELIYKEFFSQGDLVCGEQPQGVLVGGGLLVWGRGAGGCVSLTLVPDGGGRGPGLMTRCPQEKAMGNRPMEMMDREKAYIPELQISFMEHIAMPIYK